jgi:hypothetical protein
MSADEHRTRRRIAALHRKPASKKLLIRIRREKIAQRKISGVG